MEGKGGSNYAVDMRGSVAGPLPLSRNVNAIEQRRSVDPIFIEKLWKGELFRWKGCIPFRKRVAALESRSETRQLSLPPSPPRFERFPLSSSFHGEERERERTRKCRESRFFSPETRTFNLRRRLTWLGMVLSRAPPDPSPIAVS